MQSNTHVLGAGAVFYITSNMYVSQFSIIGLTATTAFTYEGGAPMNDNTGASITPAPISFSGMVAYNSRQVSNGSNTWNNVTITVVTGSVGIELIQD